VSGAYHDLNIFFYFIVVKIGGEKNYSTIFSPSLKGLNFWFHCKKISWEPEALKVFHRLQDGQHNLIINSGV